MNKEFDYNIKNYTIKELFNILDLPESYTESYLSFRINKFIDYITKNNDIKESTKLNLTTFLNQSKQMLLQYSNGLSTNNEENDIINNKKKYINSYINYYLPGTINQLKIRTINSYVNINSLFRDDYYKSTASDYEITLPNKLKNVVQIQVKSIKLSYPVSFYNISQLYNNNKIKIVINKENSYIINVPYGNYNEVSIIEAINSNLTNKGIPFSNVIFSIDKISSKTIVNVNNDPSIEFLSLIFYEQNTDNICSDTTKNNYQKQLGWSLGFKYKEYHDSLFYSSEAPVDLNIIKYIYLILDDGNNNVNNNFTGILKSSILNNNIISRISINSLYTEKNILIDHDYGIISPMRMYFGPVDILKLKVKVIDEYGMILDLNYTNFSFTLSIISLYDL